MDLYKIFTREEPIAGLEVSDSCIRLALLILSAKEKNRLGLIVLGEKALDDGVVAGGEIKDAAKFNQVLTKLVAGVKPKVNYVIVSLPAYRVYSRIYSFPPNVGGEKIEETMKLTIGFQLPVHPDKVYLDWDRVGSEEENDIFLAAVPKEIVDSYVSATRAAGLRTVAVEFHPMSAARAIEADGGSTVAVVLPDRAGTTVSVIAGEEVVFTRVLPSDLVAGSAELGLEVRKVISFYESEKQKQISSIMVVGETPDAVLGERNIPVIEAKIKSRFSPTLELEQGGSKWLVALGAAARGILPRRDDTMVSLLPVGTEEAYENQKAVAFAEFVANLAIGVSAFFGIIFLGVLIFMISLQQRFASRLGILTLLPIPSDAIALSARAEKINGLLEKVGPVLNTFPRWSKFLGELKSRVPQGITVQSLTIPSIDGQMSMSGIAQTRAILNIFQKLMEESSFISNVSLPVTNVGQKENVPFNISFRLKSPDLITEKS